MAILSFYGKLGKTKMVESSSLGTVVLSRGPMTIGAILEPLDVQKHCAAGYGYYTCVAINHNFKPRSASKAFLEQ